MPKQERSTNVPLNDASGEGSPPPMVISDDLTDVLAQIAASIYTAGLALTTVGVAFTAGPAPADSEKASWCELAGAAGVFVCRSEEPDSSLGKYWKHHADLPPPLDPDAMLRFPEVIKRVGLSRVTIWRRIRKKEFPTPIKLGENSVGWPAAWIVEWLASRPRVLYASPAEDGETPMATREGGKTAVG